MSVIDNTGQNEFYKAFQSVIRYQRFITLKPGHIFIAEFHLPNYLLLSIFIIFFSIIVGEWARIRNYL
jgi:hypothetical protein